MPELPEVETVRRGLTGAMEGQRFVQVEQRRADLRFPFPANFVARLQGQRLISLGRRAKYLVGVLESGESLVMHLGMSGSFRVDEAPTAHYHHECGGQSHDHVRFVMSNGAQITYNDPRRFGFMMLSPDLSQEPIFARLGIEPLGNMLSGSFLLEAFAGKRPSLKSALLDQSVICGLGNIYVCEALFRARLSPFRAAGSLTREEADRLAEIIRAVLEEAIAAGGSSLNDFSHTDGNLGYFQHRFQVYDQEGAPCPRCGTAILRQVQNGRSTFFCAACQV